MHQVCCPLLSRISKELPFGFLLSSCNKNERAFLFHFQVQNNYIYALRATTIAYGLLRKPQTQTKSKNVCIYRKVGLFFPSPHLLDCFFTLDVLSLEFVLCYVRQKAYVMQALLRTFFTHLVCIFVLVGHLQRYFDIIIPFLSVHFKQQFCRLHITTLVTIFPLLLLLYFIIRTFPIP